MSGTLVNVFSNSAITDLLLLMTSAQFGFQSTRKTNLNHVTKYIHVMNKNVDHIVLQNVKTKVSELVCKSKQDYHNQLVKKSTNPKTSSKMN